MSSDLDTVKTPVSLKSLAFDIDMVAEKLIGKKERYLVLQEQCVALKTKIEGLSEAIATFRKAAAVFQSLSDEESKKFQTNLKTLVTAGLQTVFDEGMDFDLDVGLERNVPVVDFFVSSMVGGQNIKLDILSARGGGVADVVAFLLQFLMVYYLEDQRNIIIADEPWKNLSSEYKLRFAQFVKIICEKSEMQIIMVTHDEEYVDAADWVYKFTKDAAGYTVATPMQAAASV